eukprot:10695969-Ditylum_brightwellii.AAC.1
MNGALQNRTTYEIEQQTSTVTDQVSTPCMSSKVTKGMYQDNFPLHILFYESPPKGDDLLNRVVSENVNILASAPINNSVLQNDRSPLKSNVDNVAESNFDRLLTAAAIIEDKDKQCMDHLDKHKSQANFEISHSKLRDENSKPLPNASTNTHTSPSIGHNLPQVSMQNESVVPPEKQQSKRRKLYVSVKSPPSCKPVKKKAKKSSKKNVKKLNPHSWRPEMAKTFPQKLMDVLMNGPKNDNVVDWLPDGKSFVILNPDEFVSAHLPHAFKECKYASFTQKLNRWGFLRITSGTGIGCFHHQLFQKGRIDLCLKMLPVHGKDKAQIKKAEKMLERKRKFFRENSNAVIRRDFSKVLDSKYAYKPPSLVGLDKCIHKMLSSRHTKQATTTSQPKSH